MSNAQTDPLGYTGYNVFRVVPQTALQTASNQQASVINGDLLPFSYDNSSATQVIPAPAPPDLSYQRPNGVVVTTDLEGPYLLTVGLKVWSAD